MFFSLVALNCLAEEQYIRWYISYNAKTTIETIFVTYIPNVIDIFLVKPNNLVGRSAFLVSVSHFHHQRTVRNHCKRLK